MSSLLTGCYLAKQKLMGDSAGDMFGSSVATNSSGTILMIGGPFDGAGGEGAGAALVYTGNSQNGWALKQKLAGDNAGDFFGQSVATNSAGTILIMGGPFDDAGGISTGAALVYTGSATAGWQLRQKLTSDSAGDQFGTSVAINSAGTILIMGGRWGNAGGTSTGAALVYTGGATDGWQLRQKLTGDSASDGFGWSVATNNDGTLLMMGGNDDGAGGINAGAVLVYTGNSVAGWQLKQKFTGDSALNLFGYSIATNNSGTLLTMGGYDANTATGAAFVYTGNAVAGWQLEQKLMSDSALDLFGYSIATNSSGTLLIIGKPFDDTGGTSAGAALVHTLSNIPCPSSSSSSSSLPISECINQCLNTGSFYYAKDTFINLYSETGSGIFIQNKKVDTLGLPLITSNESWLEYGKEFSGYGLSGFHNQEAGVVLKLDTSTRLGGQNRFHLNYGVNDSRDTIGNYHKQLISIRPQKPRNSGYLAYFANDKAWATYDVSTGMRTGGLTRNNVFSYAVDIVDYAVLSGSFIYTGNIDVNTETGKAYVYNSEKNPVLYTENFNTLNVLTFNELQDFCKKIQDCEKPKEQEPQDFCFTGDLRDSGAFQLFLSGVYNQANTTQIIIPDLDNSLISTSGETIKYNNVIYSGYILYNSWSSGDRIDWRLYNYDFVKLYSELHLGNYPPYPNTGFTLYYPNDFNSLNSLVNKLNEKVNILKTYPVWYPYACLKDTDSGIFLTGDLMKFYKNTGTTGDLPINQFNNRIDFISSRSYPQLDDNDYFSYSISISSQKKSQTNFFSGWNYLVPFNIQLEGFNKNTQLWEVLDVRNNLSGDFKNIKRIKRSMGSLPGVIKEEEEEKEEQLPEGELPEESGQQNCLDVILVEQQRIVSFNKNPLCPPQLSFKDLIVTAPKEECKKYKIDRSGNLIQTNSNIELCKPKEGGGGAPADDVAGGQDNDGGDESSVGDFYVVRTGWNLNIKNLNNQNNNLEDIGFDINKIYDKYRVSLSGFFSYPEESLLQKNSFYVQQVNLYTLDKENFTEHKTAPLCTIGADYIIDVEGVFPTEISGIWNYNMISEDSGIYRFFKTPFVKKIEENERAVKFNKISGKIISASGTGFLSTSGFGVGTVSYTTNDRYFYNPSTQSVYFSETIFGSVTGRGVISGTAIAVKKEVINQELLFGGRLANSPLQYHEIVSNGTLNSTIEDVEYVKYDVLGFYPLTGIVTGNTISGTLNTTGRLIFTGSPIGNRFAYYPEPTGFINSETLISINYNAINNFDFISINGNELTFNSDNTSFLPPIYFNNNSIFINTINNDPTLFRVTAATGVNDTIKLNSIVSGVSGNIGLSFESTGIQIVNYVSGTDFYPRLYKIVTERIADVDEFGIPSVTYQRLVRDPLMTGNISQLLLATGRYSNNSGSGNITGNVSTFQGVRNFSGIWDLGTGFSFASQTNFRENNYIGISGLYINNQLFEREFPYVVNTTIGYSNQLEAASDLNIDVAELIIKNINNTGVSGVNFRITGVI